LKSIGYHPGSLVKPKFGHLACPALCNCSNGFSRLKVKQFHFFALSLNFDWLKLKSKTNGIIGSEMAVSFCKDETRCVCCFNITDRFKACVIALIAVALSKNAR